VAARVHADGLKFGLYVTPGIPENAVRENTPIQGTARTADQIADPSVAEANYNCGHMDGINYAAPRRQRYIDSWADEFAARGVDYIKLDGVLEAGREPVFTKIGPNGTWFVGIFNTGTASRRTFRIPLSQLGIDSPIRVTDLWTGRSAGTVSGTYTTDVAPGGVTLIAAAPA